MAERVNLLPVAISLFKALERAGYKRWDIVGLLNTSVEELLDLLAQNNIYFCNIQEVEPQPEKKVPNNVPASGMIASGPEPEACYLVCQIDSAGQPYAVSMPYCSIHGALLFQPTEMQRNNAFICEWLPDSKTWGRAVRRYNPLTRTWFEIPDPPPVGEPYPAKSYAVVMRPGVVTHMLVSPRALSNCLDYQPTGPANHLAEIVECSHNGPPYGEAVYIRCQGMWARVESA